MNKKPVIARNDRGYKTVMFTGDLALNVAKLQAHYSKKTGFPISLPQAIARAIQEAFEKEGIK
jgi:hypothetical protein